MKPITTPPRPHTAGIVAALITTLGIVLEVLTDAKVLPLLPHWASIAITVAGVVLQSVTKAVHQGDTVLITRDEAQAFGVADPKPNKET